MKIFNNTSSIGEISTTDGDIILKPGEEITVETSSIRKTEINRIKKLYSVKEVKVPPKKQDKQEKQKEQSWAVKFKTNEEEQEDKL